MSRALREAAWEVDRSVWRPGRPILVGQAPGPRTEGWPPLAGDSGDRLARIAGLSSSSGARPAFEVVRRTDRHNVLDRWPGANAGGDQFPLDEARPAGARLLERLAYDGEIVGSRQVVFLGAAAAACGWAGEAYEWGRLEVRSGGVLYACRAAAFPHPSGRNRHWNDAANRARGRQFLRELFGLPVAPPQARLFAGAA